MVPKRPYLGLQCLLLDPKWHVCLENDLFTLSGGPESSRIETKVNVQKQANMKRGLLCLIDTNLRK